MAKKSKNKARERAWERKQSANLTDRYVKKAILNSKFAKDIGLKTSDITPDEIEFNRLRRGSITKPGNSHVRWVLTEATWAYRLRARKTTPILKRQQGLAEQIYHSIKLQVSPG